MSKSLSTGGKNVSAAFAGVALLTLAGGGALIFVMNGRINAERTQEVNLAAQVGSSEQVTKRLLATQAQFDQTRGKIAFLEASVPEKSYVPTLLQQLQALATSTQLFVTSIQPSVIVTPPPPAAASTDTGTKKVAALPYQTMSVSLNVTGTYMDTQKFLYGLTHFPKILSVTSIQMSPTANGPSSSASATPVTTNLKLTAFVFPTDGGDDAAPDGAAGTATPTSAPVVPPPAPPTPAGAAGRATQGAVAATRAADAHGAGPSRSL